jgi:hypothetical protein
MNRGAPVGNKHAVKNKSAPVPNSKISQKEAAEINMLKNLV